MKTTTTNIPPYHPPKDDVHCFGLLRPGDDGLLGFVLLSFASLSYVRTGLHPQPSGCERGGKDDRGGCAEPSLDADSGARARRAGSREEPAAAPNLPRHSKASSSDQVGEEEEEEEDTMLMMITLSRYYYGGP